MTGENQTSIGPAQFSGDAEPILWSFSVSEATGTVIQADNVMVESSPTRRLLRLKNGDIECYTRVFVAIEGQKYELTVPLPESGE